MIYCDTVIIQDALRSQRLTAVLIIGDSPYEKLTEFFRERGLSLSSERAYSLAIGRFIQWLSIRADEFKELSERKYLYLAYASDLKIGDSSEDKKLSPLGWSSLSTSNIKIMLNCLLEFSDWLTLRHGATALNEKGRNFESPTESLIFWRKWNHQKTGSFLSHLSSKSHGDASLREQSRQIKIHPPIVKAIAEPKAFPVEMLTSLLWQGFIVPGKQTEHELHVKYNLRDILITLLCVYGGCRASEPMHLWVDDVYEDPNQPGCALVYIHEPSEGLIQYPDVLTGSIKQTTRAHYLKEFCGNKKPLTLETGRKFSGWKGGLLSDQKRKAYRIFWIDPDAGKLFYSLWNIYLQKVRPLVSQVPWAFLSKDGTPLGFDGYADSFNAAVRRIGLVSSKELGTTTHGLRHRYGQWLNDLDIGVKEGQIAMHHLNSLSQNAYRQIPVEKIAAVFKNNEGRLNITTNLEEIS